MDISSFKQKNKNSTSFWENLVNVLNKDISFKKKTLSNKDREHLFAELHSLVNAGVSIHRAFQLIIESNPTSSFTKILEFIIQDMVSGKTMSQSCEDSGHFSAYEYVSIHIGEESGTLVTIFNELAQYYHSLIEQRRKIVSALAYPIVVLATAFLTIFFMLRFLVPMFEDIYMRFGGTLPWLTQVVLAVSRWLGTYSGTLCIGLVSLVIGINFLLKHPKQKKQYQQILLKIPWLGNRLRTYTTMRLCQTMAMVLSARIPLITGLELAQKQSTFYPLKDVLKDIQNRVMTGSPLHEGMDKTGFFDTRTIALVKIGEEINQLDSMFAKLHTHYQSEMEAGNKVFSAVFEPIVILILGVIVGVILVALYLPLFELSSNFGL